MTAGGGGDGSPPGGGSPGGTDPRQRLSATPLPELKSGGGRVGGVR